MVIIQHSECGDRPGTPGKDLGGMAAAWGQYWYRTESLALSEGFAAFSASKSMVYR